MARFRDIDRGWFNIKKNAKDLADVWVKVGVQGDKAMEQREGGITNVQLATTHEFGSPIARVPQRSFIRATFDERERVYRKDRDEIVKDKTLSLQRVRGELRMLGEKYRADVIDKIRSDIPPPLAQSTIDAKAGVTTALIDTMQLLRSIDVQVSWERG